MNGGKHFRSFNLFAAAINIAARLPYHISTKPTSPHYTLLGPKAREVLPPFDALVSTPPPPPLGCHSCRRLCRQIRRGSRRSGLFRVTGPDSVNEWRGGGALVTSNTYPSFPSISRPSLRDSSPSSARPSTSLSGDTCGVFMRPPVGSFGNPPSALRSRRRARFIV